MKPLYTILISLLALPPTMYAQNEIQMNGVPQTAKESSVPGTSEEIKNNGEKRTGVGNRWYDYYDFINALSGNVFSGGQSTILPIWHDPGILMRNSIFGSGHVDYLSIAQVIDPSAAEFNDTSLINMVNNTASGAGNMMYVSSADTYFVDSISIAGSYYIAKPSHTAADSLIISITPNKKYYTDTATWVHSFGADTLDAFAPTAVDSINRCAYSDTTAYSGKTWAVPLTSSMATGISIYKFSPPGGPVFIPAGYHAAISVTFKSTDNWIKNIDSIDEYNRFMPLFGYEYPYPAGGYMSYWRVHYKNDCNGSSLMHSNDTAHYVPAIIEQGRSLPTTKFYPYEYANIGAHITCVTCKTVVTEVQNISPIILTSRAYPNPANNELIVPVALSKPADVEIDLVNILGQVLQTKYISRALNEKANFNVKNFPQGLYFYSIKTNDNQQTGRFVIVHQ